MAEVEPFENYPLWIVFVSTLLSISVYSIGAFIVYQLGLLWLTLYLAYVLLLEVRLLRKSCVNCYYFGKTCAFGKGRLSCLIFRKGEVKEFGSWQITWKDIIPDFLVTIIPVVAAVILLIRDFNWTTLLLLISILALGFPGAGLVRSQLACKHCKQKDLGCPAQQLFNKK
ncbi:MAG: hypothetical protein ABH851_07500 [Methanobacteriota archaeon]